MDKVGYRELVETIAQAAWNSREHLRDHLKRDKKKNKNNHGFIGKFQGEVKKYLDDNYSSKYQWYTEEKKSDTVVKDSIDIIGEQEGRNCIIEIDTVRHDQIAPKFVSRLALWGLEEPIDYIILLYDSTIKNGKHNAEKFVRYTYAILKAINKDSSLIGIYVHTDKDDKNKDDVEYWDCENQAFTINVKKYKDKCMPMSECAREAIKYYLGKHKTISFEELQERFNDGITFILDTDDSRAKFIGETRKDRNENDREVYVYSQFRYNGRQHNWNRFVEVCKGTKEMKQNDKMTIVETYKTDAYEKPHN